MREQIGLLPEKHWYSLVAAAPVPETGESVNVGVVFGNGRAFHLVFIDALPRLSCLVTSDQLSVYEAILEACADRVGRGIDPAELASLLGPQLVVRPPRALYAPLDQSTIEQFKTRFLAAPQESQQLGEVALIHRSREDLDRAIERTSFPSGMIAYEVRPNSLYGDRIERFTSGHRVPRLSRALRGFGRDVLLDSLTIDRGYHARAIREVGSRIQHAFFVYEKRLREVIKLRANIDIRTVGVLHQLPSDATPDLVDLHDMVRESWLQQKAEVIEGTSSAIVEQLEERAIWARGR